MLGGYALSGRGPRWARILSGAVALTTLPIWAFTVTSFAGPGLAVDTPRGAWAAVYYIERSRHITLPDSDGVPPSCGSR
jgi:hypothetical protein